MKENRLNIGDVVVHFKWHCGKTKEECLYKIIGFAKDANDLSDLVVYVSKSTGVLWVRELNDFMSKVDKVKYPNVEQKYKFEKVVK